MLMCMMEVWVKKKEGGKKKEGERKGKRALTGIGPGTFRMKNEHYIIWGRCKWYFITEDPRSEALIS